MKTYPLRTFIHRVLLVRLGIATAVIAIVVGLITYGIQRAFNVASSSAMSPTLEGGGCTPSGKGYGSSWNGGTSMP